MENQIITHGEMVNQLKKSGADILASLTPEKCDLLHACLGLMTEVGEVCDAVKKHIIYQQPLDRENVIEESGDIEFYHEQLRQCLDFVRATAIQMNMKKLGIRYPGYVYANTKAKERADKV